jgi:hypothetical protein
MGFKIENNELVLDPSSNNIVEFGAFYDDDCDHGFSLTFTDEQFSRKWITGYVNAHTDDVKKTLNTLTNKNKDIANLWSILHSTIKQYNVKVWGTEKRQMFKQFELDYMACCDEITTIFTVIAVLQALGQIKEDDMNGMHVVCEFFDKDALQYAARQEAAKEK